MAILQTERNLFYSYSLEFQTPEEKYQSRIGDEEYQCRGFLVTSDLTVLNPSINRCYEEVDETSF